MGQVPKSEEIIEKSYILIVGSGRIARHLIFYFESLNIKVKNWSRKKNSLQELKTLFDQSDKCLVLIKDDAISEFINTNSFLKNNKTFHCSGALNIDGIECLHPLMTFTEELYPLNIYSQIPIALFNENIQLKNIHPQLKNPTFYIPKDKKCLYHALCVLSGNFVQILWTHTLKEWTSQLSLSPDLLKPYIQMITTQFWKNAQTNLGIQSLTGPLARKDFSTIQKHLIELADLSDRSNSPLAELYLAFLKTSLTEDEYQQNFTNVSAQLQPK